MLAGGGSRATCLTAAGPQNRRRIAGWAASPAADSELAPGPAAARDHGWTGERGGKRVVTMTRPGRRPILGAAPAWHLTVRKYFTSTGWEAGRPAEAITLPEELG